MKKTERFQNIKLDIHTQDFDPPQDLMSVIRTELRKIMRVYGSVLGVDVYLTQAEHKMARMRVGAPGRSFIAEASSDDWNQSLTEAADQLRSQITGRY